MKKNLIFQFFITTTIPEHGNISLSHYLGKIDSNLIYARQNTTFQETAKNDKNHTKITVPFNQRSRAKGAVNMRFYSIL